MNRQRDMNRREFHAALERNGFCKPTLLWISSKDDSSTSYGMILTRGTGKVHRRATLAHIIRSREETREQARKDGELSKGLAALIGHPPERIIR